MFLIPLQDEVISDDYLQIEMFHMFWESFQQELSYGQDVRPISGLFHSCNGKIQCCRYSDGRNLNLPI